MSNELKGQITVAVMFTLVLLALILGVFSDDGGISACGKACGERGMKSFSPARGSEPMKCVCEEVK